MESNKNEVEDEGLKQLDSSFSFVVRCFSNQNMREESNREKEEVWKNFSVYAFG